MFVNISAYKFIALDNLPALRISLMQCCEHLGFKGTILLSEEGINIALSATRQAVDQFAAELAKDQRFADIQFKESVSPTQPFRRFRVRIKSEIIRFEQPDIKPRQHTVPHLPAEKLKKWLDEGKEMLLLDTRNRYEVAVGSFELAVDLDIETFTEFPQAAAKKLADQAKDKPVVMFCTGGVRCEKAGPALEEQGFSEIYQLDGGILKYFENCGGSHWQGECFIFDDRVAVDTDLVPSTKGYCPDCVQLLPEPYRHLPQYQRVKLCPNCLKIKAQKKANQHTTSAA